MIRPRVKMLVATAATGLALIGGLAQAAVAGPAYTTTNGAIPSGPNQGQDEPGPGARIANKAFGYYIGRIMPGGRLVQTGGRASHHFGRITGHDVNICGWLHKSARAQKTGQAPTSCSKATADRIWQRTTFGKRFSSPAGAKRQSGTPVSVTAGKNCRLLGNQFFYNYFVDTGMKNGKFRDAAGAISTAQLSYRYLTRDGKAAVVRDEKLGWGFVPADCLTMRDPATNKHIKTYNDQDTGTPPKF